jgi:hypothetical protein
MGTPLATVNAERDVGGLTCRLACIRAADSGRDIRFVLGYLGPAKEEERGRALLAWIEHGAGTGLLDLEEEAGAFRAAAPAVLSGLKLPPDGNDVTATAERSRRTARSGRR